jgi:hypothetical protein
LRNNVALAPLLTQVGNKGGLGREGEDDEESKLRRSSVYSDIDPSLKLTV